MAKDGMDMFQHMLMRLYHNDGDARRHAFAACIAIGGGGHTQLHKELLRSIQHLKEAKVLRWRFGGRVGRAVICVPGSIRSNKSSLAVAFSILV